MTTNWSYHKSKSYWKGIQVSDYPRSLPFLALMLGDSKGFMKAVSKKATSFEVVHEIQCSLFIDFAGPSDTWFFIV